MESCPGASIGKGWRAVPGSFQGKGGDEDAASGRKNGGRFPGERFDLRLPVLGMIRRIITVGTLQD